ncbi:putative methyltransferase-domain-containing protein [Dichotomocladium elegans]|nr:putative methyltransferase-domain-containing protein [Dichotomocladium elegans]
MVNELGLFRRADLGSNGTVAVACTAEGNDHKGVQIEVRDNASNGFHGSGKGLIEYRISSFDTLTSAVDACFYLTLHVDNDKVKKSPFQHTLPLTVGPVTVDPETPAYLPSSSPIEAWPDTTPMVHDSFRVLEGIMIRESWDAGIPGKIWDSALVMLAFLKNLAQQGKHHMLQGHVVDLSAGTGLLGLYVGSHGGSLVEKVTITELQEAIPLILDNMSLNKRYCDRVKVKPLLWGDTEQATEVGKADVIVASDVLYEAEFFEDLAKSLADLAKPSTRVYIGYKRRGLDVEEEERFWSLCRHHHFAITLINETNPELVPRLGQEINVQIYCLTPLKASTPSIQ